MLMESLMQSIKGSWNAEEVISIFIIIDLWKKSDFYSVMDVVLIVSHSSFLFRPLVLLFPFPIFLT